MTGDQSRGLRVGARVCWGEDKNDRGTVTEMPALTVPAPSSLFYSGRLRCLSPMTSTIRRTENRKPTAEATEPSCDVVR